MSSLNNRAQHALRDAARLLRNWAQVGYHRALRSLIPALQMTVAGVGGFLLAGWILGHGQPIFAAVAAMVATGFTKEPHLRKVIEVAAGCTLGVLMGDLVLHTLGQSWVTAAAVVFFSIMVARFIASSPMLAMQMGLQALLVVMLPIPADSALGPFTRSVDAIIGGLTAMVVALITPRDPRTEPLRELKTVVDALTRGLRETAHAMRDSDSREAWHGLIRARSVQSQIDAVTHAVRSAQELTAYSPTHRRHRHDVRELARTADKLDLAVRSLRVLSRRAISTIDHATLSDTETQSLARILDELADGAALLTEAASVSSPSIGKNMPAAEKTIAAVAVQLHPIQLEIDDLEGETMVLLIRTMVVDLLEATGMEHQEAVEKLPTL